MESVAECFIYYECFWLMCIVITEEQKTPEQKDREARLLKDLLELIDERDKLERIKMSTQLE